MIEINGESFFEVELYFGVTYEDAPDWLFHAMAQIQADFDNGTMGKGIDYYAAMYGY